MSPQLAVYTMLGIAVISEVVGSSFLKLSDGFTRLWPSLAVFVFFGIAFFLLSQVIKTMPLGMVYAIWSGVGIVLTGLVGWVLFRQSLDIAALCGIGLIIAGVLVINVFSSSTGH